MLSNISKQITSPIERLTNPLSRRNTATAEEPAWHAAFPAPRHQSSSLPDVEKEDVLALLKDGKLPGDRGGFLLVDVRRNDHEVSPSRATVPWLLASTRHSGTQG